MSAAKAQISFEMQLYMALAGLALLFAAGEIARATPEMRLAVGEYNVGVFIGLVNENILSGNSSFEAWIPEGMCNATARGTEVETPYGNFSTIVGLNITNSTFCPDGESSWLRLSYGLLGGGVGVSR